MRRADGFGDVVAQLTDGSERLVVVASRMARDAHVPVRVVDERRLAAFLDRARELAPDVARDDDDGVQSLCSAHFVSGAGWAWRVTAALVRGRSARSQMARPIALGCPLENGVSCDAASAPGATAHDGGPRAPLTLLTRGTGHRGSGLSARRSAAAPRGAAAPDVT